ncbi:hypothetical protein [Nocardioides mesophilus]|uniref:hypothetical protein n=1 Tax=Nocardioides mesophilus TaxID=433659 RepID=UPI001CB6BC63|nr:hypothetical protein [Nocardioides mesophilus]
MSGPLVQSVDWLALAAPVTLAVAAVLVLLLDAFGGRSGSPAARLLPTTLTLVALVVAAVPAARLWNDPRSTFCTGGALEGPASCSFAVDRFTLVFWGWCSSGPQWWPCSAPRRCPSDARRWGSGASCCSARPPGR